MTDVKTASCSCGQLRAICTGEPKFVSICHCDACRHRTGSAFGMAAFFPCAQVTTEGNAKTFTRPSDMGYPVTFHFCPECGASVYWEPSRKPDMIAVGAGSFADPNLAMPQQPVNDARRYKWTEFPDAMIKRAD